ncbi:hypothetical protein HMPREF9469_00931 [ [[Clostridium] citroniae WAL-17108]|uniref:Uncharacterized protein n=1 Tax=[Clostridium] citroniae WAL-17108 TaxID=742733 RepID=G5HEQ8_9FIRM|nr:hypothetical protein HMPREF9469_00931 [ [[Clostridium] citroniae WAL-17108]MCC3383276.1 hypothetical protein [Enterocloster citroniae]
MKQCRFTGDFCTCIYDRKVPKGACYGEYRVDSGRIPYVCDDYRLRHGKLTVHIVSDDKAAPVIQRYSKGSLRSYLYGKNIWFDIEIPQTHCLAKMILEKRRIFHLSVEQLPDSNQMYKKMRRPLLTRSWTKASRLKVRRTPERGINAIPQCRGNGTRFEASTNHDSIWK